VNLLQFCVYFVVIVVDGDSVWKDSEDIRGDWEEQCLDGVSREGGVKIERT